jgi:rRNA maturation protein Nop10
MTTYLAESLSDCCGSLVIVEGRTTLYHKCTACGKACDLAAPPLPRCRDLPARA